MNQEKKKIMLIDDNAIDNYIHKTFLEDKGLSNDIVMMGTVDKAINYLDGLQSDLTAFPDLILLDINLPALNGFDFLNRFDSKYSDELKRKCKIVVLSSSEKEDDMVNMIGNSLVRNYFLKPLSDKAIGEIRDILNS